jgi:hypothetical protein
MQSRSVVDPLDRLLAELPGGMAVDRASLTRTIERLRRRGAAPAEIERVARAVAASRDRASRRAQRVPRIVYPPELPVSARRDDIAAAMLAHQVIIVCGETGSGKTTQLPKICLEHGRGIRGLIGHTQPRRIAARSVATRIAQELGTPLGEIVGYKVRFSDQTRPDAYIKLMTDGILLAETQSERTLAAYDTIIIDEAHERSLNVDFLLGYLKQLLPRRPDAAGTRLRDLVWMRDGPQCSTSPLSAFGILAVFRRSFHRPSSPLAQAPTAGGQRSVGSGDKSFTARGRILHFQLAHLGSAHTGRVDRHEHGSMKQIAGGVDQSYRFVLCENRRQAPRSAFG